MNYLTIYILMISTFVHNGLSLNKHHLHRQHSDYYDVEAGKHLVAQHDNDDDHHQDIDIDIDGGVEFLFVNMTRFARQAGGFRRNRLQEAAVRSDTSDNMDSFFNLRNIVRRVFGKREGCNDEQNTTSMIFFSQPNSGANYESRIDRNFDIENLRESIERFNPKNPTFVIIHGWFGCDFSAQEYAIKAKELILQKRSTNVFIVDWSHLAHSRDYMRSVKKMREAAEDLAEIFRNLQLAFPGFDTNDVHLIGYSLGAHVSGILGRLLNGQIKQITGLDPAGVSIGSLSPENKLTSDDARYVIALHTNGIYFGTKMNLANHDIYINGGLEQPFCKNSPNSLIAAACSHRVAAKIISTPIKNKCMLIAYRCFNWDKYSSGACGFCKSSPNDCLSIVYDWQHVDNSEVDKLIKKSQVPSTKKGAINVPWTLRAIDRRYYIKTSRDQRQFCAFTYQIVAKFSDDFTPARREQWGMDIKIGQSFNIPFYTMNKLKSNTSLTVYDVKGKTKSITGSNVFVSLLTIGPSQPIYDSLPIKINRVVLSMSQEDPEAQIYINYMSHISNDVRQDKSGRVRNVNWNLVSDNEPSVIEDDDSFVEDKIFSRRRRFQNNS